MSASAPSTSLPPQSWWEEHFFPRLEAIADQAYRKYVLGSVPIVGSGGPAQSSPNQHGLVPVFQLPLSPVVLAQSLIAARALGVSAPLFPRQAITVPANGSAQIAIPVTTNYVMVVVGPVRVLSSVQDPDVTATIVVDTVNLLFNAFPLTMEADETSPEYGVIRSSIEATIYNATANPATVTYDSQVVEVLQQEYDDIWVPLLQQSYQVLKGYANSLRAAGAA